MALTTVSSDRLSTNVKNTNFTAAEKQDLTDDILPLAGQLGNRNLIINGAMQVAQRGTDETGVAANTYATVDRFKASQSGTDEYVEQHQVDVSSGTTPYTLGFRKAFQVKNGNQTSGAGAADYVLLRTELEAQDIANSGWNYISASSYITLQFWVKSSVAQNFYGYLRTIDGTNYHYPFETGSLSADTWTKVTKTIPGNSNLQFNNDNGRGFQFTFLGLMGTDFTSSSATLNTWHATGSGDIYTPDNTTTWYTTNDATLELTGVQLEVGSVATDFEHRSYGQDLALCQRYYYSHNSGASEGVGNFTVYQANDLFGYIPFPVEMRAIPSLVTSNATDHFVNFAEASADTFDSFASIWDKSERGVFVNANASQGVSRAASAKSSMVTTGNAASKLAFNAEL